MNEIAERLKTELKNRGVRPAEAARAMGVPANRLTRIIDGTRPMSLDTAYRIAFYFNEAVAPWYAKQVQHDMNQYEQMYADEVKRQVTPWGEGE